MPTMNLYRKWIDHMEEEGLNIHRPMKQAHSFEWGLEHLGIRDGSGEPREVIREYTQRHLANSKAYFSPRKLSPSEFRLEGNRLSFPSSVDSFVTNNNTARFSYFPLKRRDKVIIVIPHWNAPGSKYDRICDLMRYADFASLRMTLPYHAERGPTGSEEDSMLMVSANIGLTLQAMQQSVKDILSAVDWLENQGYRQIGMMGASIGSCSAFLAAVHDARIKHFFANLMSSYFGDVVWTGRSTSHVQQSLEHHVSQSDVHDFWLLNSPIAFVDKSKTYNPGLKQLIMSARYDTTFVYSLTEQMLEAYRQHAISIESHMLPCGHYSLGRSWFKWIDAYHIVSFFHSN